LYFSVNENIVSFYFEDIGSEEDIQKVGSQCQYRGFLRFKVCAKFGVCWLINA